MSAGQYEYRPELIHGRYLHDRETLVQAVTELGAGFWVMTPFETVDGYTVPVMRTNDSAADRWYSPDVAAISAARGLAHSAPYFVDAEAMRPTSPARPSAPTVIAFANNHLQYPLTCFALASMLAGGAWLVFRADRATPIFCARLYTDIQGAVMSCATGRPICPFQEW